METSEVVVRERVVARKFADAAARDRGEAEAVAVVVVTTVDGRETERDATEWRRGEPGFAEADALAADHERAALAAR